MYNFTIPCCFHSVHKICAQEFFKSSLNSNELSKLRCPHCPESKMEVGCYSQVKLIEILLPEKIYTDKYKVLLNNYVVARSRGRIYHCPESNC